MKIDRGEKIVTLKIILLLFFKFIYLYFFKSNLYFLIMLMQGQKLVRTVGTVP